jgi:ABC-type Fe3+ transport system permease subunit
MNTLVRLLLMISKHITWVCMIVFTSLIVFNFVYTLHTEHATARQRLMDDQWLLARCGEPDFYMRLKQHTDLCEGVEANARRSILLHSFTAALSSAQLCGFDSCGNIAKAVVDTLLRGGLITVAIAIAILFIMPTLCIIAYRKFVDTVAEDHLKHKYNMPYGLNTSLIHSHQEQAFIDVYNNPRAIRNYDHP